MNEVKGLIFLLGGDITRDASGKWRTLDVHDSGDKFGFCNDRWRVIATAYLHKEFSDYLIVASCGISNCNDFRIAPLVSSIIKNELVELGVPAERILEDSISFNTYQQLCILLFLLKNYKMVNDMIVTNEWHIM